tara:strand:+ start:333 stop:692 length:360 start_codon:yes stop_codon:yes gene_type:complete
MMEANSSEAKQSFYNKSWWEEFRRAEVEGILDLTGKKNSDYTGGTSCDNPFENFDGSREFGIDPLLGLSLRMQDKFQRMKSFCNDGQLSVESNGDTIRDIYRDLIGYSLIALGMIERSK